METDRWIWFDGKLVPWDRATVHVTTHALHYGSSVFEGLRVYPSDAGPRVLALREHVQRMFRSAKIFNMDLRIQPDTLCAAILDTVRANRHEAAYVRPLSIRGAGVLGPYVPDNPVHTIVLTQELAHVLGEDAQDKGISLMVSSFRRMAPDTHPAMAKLGGNYVITQLMAAEARARGYTEAIALDVAGHVSEAGGANVFMVLDGQLLTPSLGDSILGGITRRIVTELAANRGLLVHERSIPRELLYIAEEVFLTGTAVEITPVREIDGRVVGRGDRGPITTMLQRDFFDLVHGMTADLREWLTPVATEVEMKEPSKSGSFRSRG